MQTPHNLQSLRAVLDASGGGEVLFERDARDSVCAARIAVCDGLLTLSFPLDASCPVWLTGVRMSTGP